jgi:hypothetical protein
MKVLAVAASMEGQLMAFRDVLRRRGSLVANGQSGYRHNLRRVTPPGLWVPSYFPAQHTPFSN